MIAVSELEERLTRLEMEVEALKRERAGAASDKKPWWEQISGVFKDSPEFEEAARLGREWRESQRMEYDEDDTQVKEDADGSA
jgi:hypothetical protein